jgi:hypothetical protein
MNFPVFSPASTETGSLLTASSSAESLALGTPAIKARSAEAG